MADNYNEMGKEALRSEMRERELSYAKLNNDGMRQALRDNDASLAEQIAADDAAQAQADAEYEERQRVAARVAEQTKREETVILGKSANFDELNAKGLDGRCPCCGIDLDNGWCDYQSMCETNKKAAGEMKREYVCLGCNGEFGPLIKRVARSAPKGGTGIQIEKNREQKNGVKRPSVGGVCRAVWDFCDNAVAAGTPPTAKMVREEAPQHGWNANNASIEFYQWRKFNGITGRSK